MRKNKVCVCFLRGGIKMRRERGMKKLSKICADETAKIRIAGEKKKNVKFSF